jgi:eukaryotic-like serine/threonine-protein kinase
MQAQRAEPASPQPGDVVAGKYELVRPIGLGAMGLVFEATHLRLHQRVAIKFMQPKLVGQQYAVARFEREGRAASRLTSPHSTRIFDVETTPEGVPYIVSELLEGRDLHQELEKRNRLTIVEATTFIIQACAVMAEAHALGIVHRDLKPSNLFLARTSKGPAVKVLDFGISKMEEELELTTTGVLLGSPRYMSPEQVEAKRVDRRTDIWALGVILFRAIAGVHPFEGSTTISLALAILSQPPRDLEALVPGVPPALVVAIGKALKVELPLRHSTARDFAEALAPFATREAAALAMSLTREVPDNEHTEPLLTLPRPDTLTDAPDIDALIQGSLIPPSPESPERSARGTWSWPPDHAVETPSFSPARLPAEALTWRPAEPSPFRRIAGVLGVLVLLAGLGFAYVRYGAAIRAYASDFRARAGTSRPAAPGTDATSSPAVSATATTTATTTSTPSASATASASAEATPSAASAARTAKPPGGDTWRPPKGAAVPAPGASATKSLERAFGSARD